MDMDLFTKILSLFKMLSTPIFKRMDGQMVVLTIIFLDDLIPLPQKKQKQKNNNKTTTTTTTKKTKKNKYQQKTKRKNNNKQTVNKTKQPKNV